MVSVFVIMLREVASFRQGTWLKVSFILLAYSDLVFTIFALKLGFSELNPYMERIATQPLAVFLVKGVPSVGIAWLVPSRLLLPAIAFMSFVISWNIKELILFLV